MQSHHFGTLTLTDAIHVSTPIKCLLRRISFD